MTVPEKVRLQVPVPADVAEQIGELASAMEKPLATMAVMLLEESIKARQNFTDWLASKVTEALLPRKGRKRLATTEEVRLELRVPAKVAKDIEALARRLEHTSVRMATLLLKAGVDENSGIIELVTSDIVRRALGKPSRKKKGAWE